MHVLNKAPYRCEYWIFFSVMYVTMATMHMGHITHPKSISISVKRSLGEIRVIPDSG